MSAGNNTCGHFYFVFLRKAIQRLSFPFGHVVLFGLYGDASATFCKCKLFHLYGMVGMVEYLAGVECLPVYATFEVQVLS